jgi:uncharacterized protein (DUF983 family)
LGKVPPVTALPTPDPPPKVTRLKVIERGLACRCPNCGLRTLFKPGEFFKVNERCGSCGLTFEKGAGAFLGPFVMNYAVTAFGFIVPIIILFVLGKITASWTLALCAVAALGLPFLFYRRSWGWWLGVYYFFLPDNLPANLGGRPEDDE